MSSGLSDQRGVMGMRGLDASWLPPLPGAAEAMAMLAGNFQRSTWLIGGMADGLLFGPAIYDEQGSVVGRGHALVPQGFEDAGTRVLNQGVLLTGIERYNSVFAWALWEGFRNEVKGYADMLWMLFDGSLAAMIAQFTQLAEQNPVFAWRFGRELCGGMAAGWFSACDGPLEGYVEAVGKMLGSLLPDLLVAMLTGGTGFAMKLGVGAAKEAAGSLAAAATRRADEIAKLIDKLMKLPVPPGYRPAFAGVPEGYADDAMEAFTGPLESRMTGEAAKGVPQAAKRQPASGATGAPPSPAAGPPTPAAGSAIRPALSATAAGATAARTTVRLDQALRKAHDDTWLVFRQLERGKHLSTARELLTALAGGGRTRRNAILQLALDPAARICTPEIDQLIRRGNSFDSSGRIREAALAVFNPEGLVSGADGVRRIGTWQRAVLDLTVVSKRADYPNFNSKEPWPTAIREHKELLVHLAQTNPKLAAMVMDKPQALHALGPGMKVESALGMALGSDFYNMKIQAGGFSNPSLGIEARGKLELVSADGTRTVISRDGYGLEGFIIDDARTVALRQRELNPSSAVKVVSELEVFTETWGDELLETPFFAAARERALSLMPQHYLKEVRYRLRTHTIEAGITTKVLELDGLGLPFPAPGVAAPPVIDIYPNGLASPHVSQTLQ